MIERHLALAEKHVTLAIERVRLQREVIAKLERTGRHAGAARRRLERLEGLLAQHFTNREQLRAELFRNSR